MQDKSHDNAGESRRDFLKKAGAVAWVVPTIQIVNMAAAGAQTNGSIVSTTPPPSTSKPPECTKYVQYRLKADWTGQGYSWTTGEGAQDCLVGGDWTGLDGDDLGGAISLEGNDKEVVFKHSLDDCKVIKAAHKAGSAQQGEHCYPATVAGDGSYAKFAAADKDISHIELIVECCVEKN